MFRRLPDLSTELVEIEIDGKSAHAREGDTVAAALLSAGYDQFRQSPVGASPRGPYCLMGVCFECLVTVNGVRYRQACMIAVEAGMRVETGVADMGIAAE